MPGNFLRGLFVLRNIISIIILNTGTIIKLQFTDKKTEIEVTQLGPVCVWLKGMVSEIIAKS